MFQAHAPAQGACENLFCALKLLANLQVGGSNLVDTIFEGFQERSRQTLTCKLRRFIEVYNHEAVKIGDLEKNSEAIMVVKTGTHFVNPSTRASRELCGRAWNKEINIRSTGGKMVLAPGGTRIHQVRTMSNMLGSHRHRHSLGSLGVVISHHRSGTGRRVQSRICRPSLQRCSSTSATSRRSTVLSRRRSCWRFKP